MARSAHASSAYEEAHRGADSLFPRDLWDLGQADLGRITETFRALASKFEAVLRLNPSVKYPHPGRSLVKRVGSAEVRVELALTGPKGRFPELPEEFEYMLSVFRTPRRNPLRAFLERRDPTEWREIRRYAPADVREAGTPLRDALEAVARDAFRPGGWWIAGLGPGILEVTASQTSAVFRRRSKEEDVANKRQINAEEARSVGSALKVDWTKVDLEQFRRGLEVELEHGARDPETNVTNDDLALTGKIAWAHLKEFPDYYSRLDKLEAEADAYWSSRR